MRDFTYDEEQLKSGKSELTKLHTDKKKQFGPLVRSETDTERIKKKYFIHYLLLPGG